MSGNASLKPAGPTGRQKAILAILATLALVSVFVLPALVDEPWLAGDPEARPAAPPPSGRDQVSPSTAAEKTRYRQESQTVLAQIIAVRDRLRERQVETWSAVPFKQAMDRVTAGDERYQYGDYAASLADYRQALEILENVETEGKALLEQSIAEGASAIESLNANVADSAVGLAIRMAPQDPRVEALAARLETLPAVTSAIERGDEASALDRFAEARDAYREAVSLDPAHQRAAQSLAEASGGVTDAAFRGHMSRGLAAMERGDYAGAREAFRAAGTVRPGDPAITQALAQVANRESSDDVDQRLRQAAELEASESWQAAVGQYEELLAEDPSLNQARVRLIPAQVRAALDADLAGFIEEPLRLSSRATYQKAQARLADARSIASPGPKLSGQIATVERLLVAAVSSVDVEFLSDNQTEVTLFRVAELGRFDRRQLKLKPGKYVAAGTRRGFRDVRVEFTITGVEELEPIVVRCEEPI